MGGRSKAPEDTNRQINLHHSLLQARIGEIRSAGDLLRARRQGMQGSEGGSGALMHGNVAAGKKCACCLQRSLPAGTKYATCPICGWIDDPLQNANPDLMEGRNPISLREARRRWQERQMG